MAALLTRVFQPGERIFREGDAADCAYVVSAGRVEIRTHSGGEDRCVAVIGPGELLGEMAMLDNAPRSASAVASAPTELTIITRDQLVTRLASADPVLHLLLKVLLNRLRGQLHDEPVDNAHPASVVQDAVLARIQLENELKEGLGAGEMRMHLQPIAEVGERRIQGFEALVRWQHPERGMVRPDLFIKVAEESGLIVPLGRWILREACLAALKLDREPNKAEVQGRSAFISVNVSPGQFRDPEFVPVLAAILRETGLDPHRLKLEITESVLTDADAARQWIDDCKALGVRIALDDFGTGYSSLSYLHEFRIDTLKIDQSFVRRMLQDARSEQIVATIIRLGKVLGMDVITEGVETEDHLHRLASLGCDYAQGYLIARPTAVEAFF